MNTEAQQLVLARERLAAIGAGDWRLASDREGRFVEVMTPKGQLLEIARFDAGATDAEMDFVAHAAAMVRLLLGLVDRCADKVRRLERQSSPVHGGGVAAGDGGGGEADASAPLGPSGHSPRERGESGAAPNFAAEAAMRCGDAAFKRWLMDCHGLESPATDERTVQKLRGLLGVVSRRELNSDADAAQRWRRLRGEFEAWSRVPQASGAPVALSNGDKAGELPAGSGPPAVRAGRDAA